MAPQAVLPAAVPSTGWRITNLAGEADLGGYSVGESLAPGDDMRLKIRGTAATVQMDVYRMGHYDGAGAALVAQAVAPLTAQPACSTANRTVDCSAWSVTHTFDTDGWEPGVYFTKLTDNLNRERYIPTVIRSTDHAGTVVVMAYVVACCGPLLLSGYRDIAIFGVVNLIAVAIIARLTIDGFASVWCGWAAISILWSGSRS